MRRKMCLIAVFFSFLSYFFTTELSVTNSLKYSIPFSGVKLKSTNNISNFKFAANFLSIFICVFELIECKFHIIESITVVWNIWRPSLFVNKLLKNCSTFISSFITLALLTHPIVIAVYYFPYLNYARNKTDKAAVEDCPKQKKRHKLYLKRALSNSNYLFFNKHFYMLTKKLHSKTQTTSNSVFFFKP